MDVLLPALLELSENFCLAISTGQLSVVKKLCEKRFWMSDSNTLRSFKVETLLESCRCFAIPNRIVYSVPKLGFFPKSLRAIYCEAPKLDRMIMTGRCCCTKHLERHKEVREISPLVVACYYGHKAIVSHLLTVDPGAINRSGYMTPLMMTTICRNESSGLEIAKLLLHSGADVNIVDRLSGLHPLQFALWKNNVNMTRLLLEHGVDFKSMDMSPLPLAKTAECMKLLLDAGVKVTHGISHQCPLFEAIREHRVDQVREYLNNPAFQKEHDNADNAVLFHSDTDLNLIQHATNSLCQRQTIKGKPTDFEILDLLLEKGFAVDSCIDHLSRRNKRHFWDSMYIEMRECLDPATFFAATNARPKTLDYLLKRGADVNFRNAYGITVLMVLARRQRNHLSDTTQTTLEKQCLSILLQYGIDLNTRDICGRSAIYHALMHCAKKSFIFKWLLTKNVDLYAFRYSTGCTRFLRKKSLLYHACDQSGCYAIKLLLDHGYDVRKDTWLMKRKRIPKKLFQNKKALKEIVTIFRKPEDLKCLCRNEIRRVLGVDIDTVLKLLQLPTMLKKFLLFQ